MQEVFFIYTAGMGKKK